MFSWFDDAPETAFYRNTQRRARKPHVCSLCKKTIAPGEVYTYSVSLVDGVLEVSKYHIRKCYLDKRVPNA